jgi:diacylglycerol kinase (ATP)
MAAQKKKMMLIINPVAGKREAAKNLAELIQVFYAGGYTASVFVTGKSGDAAEFAAQYGGNFDLIVCSGGDGTMNETVTGIIRGGLGVPIGYMPSGSYNDFAEYQGLSKDVLKAAHNIIKGDPRYVDVVKFAGRYFINAADFGAFTWLPYTTPQQKKNTLGAYAYLLEGIKDLSKIKRTHLRVMANGGSFEDDYLFGIICNATMLAGVLSRKGKIIQADDGIFEVGMVQYPETPLDFQEILQAVQLEDLGDPHITFIKTNRVTIETDEPVDWSLDGERFTLSGTAEAETLHSRITLVC